MPFDIISKNANAELKGVIYPLMESVPLRVKRVKHGTHRGKLDLNWRDKEWKETRIAQEGTLCF